MEICLNYELKKVKLFSSVAKGQGMPGRRSFQLILKRSRLGTDTKLRVQ